MFRRIREHFEMKKLYKDSLKVLVIKSASIITKVDEMVDIIGNQVKNMDSISTDDLQSVIQMAESFKNNTFQNDVIVDYLKNHKRQDHA